MFRLDFEAENEAEKSCCFIFLPNTDVSKMMS